MNASLFNDFLISADALRVYDGDRLLFASAKDGLHPLMEYIAGIASHQNDITIFDKIMGNAAALLSVKADCHRVYSPLAVIGAVFLVNFTGYGGGGIHSV